MQAAQGAEIVYGPVRGVRGVESDFDGVGEGAGRAVGECVCEEMEERVD